MFCCFLPCCKQRVSKVCMSTFSVLLFLAGGFVIYISICLFFNFQLLGGALNKADASATDSETKAVYLNSYVHFGILLSGILAIIMALLGCCTSRVSDKCCVSCYTLLLLAFLGGYTIFGLLMTMLALKDATFVGTLCSQKEIFPAFQVDDDSRPVVKLAKLIETKFLNVTASAFVSID